MSFNRWRSLVDGTEITLAIPDSVLNNADRLWWMDEGSGDVLNDEFGNVDGDLFNVDWSTPEDFDGATVFSLADNSMVFSQTDFAINATQTSWAGWFRFNDHDDFAHIAAVHDQDDRTQRADDGWELKFDGSSDFLNLTFRDGGATGDPPVDSNTSGNTELPRETWIFVGLSIDGDDVNLYVWDSDEQIINLSGSDSRGTASNSWLALMNSFEDATVDGEMAFDLSAESILSELDFEEIWEDTRPENFSVTSGNVSDLYDAFNSVSAGGEIYIEGTYTLDENDSPLLVKDDITVELANDALIEKTSSVDEPDAIMHNAESGETISGTEGAGGFTIIGGTFDATQSTDCAIFTFGCADGVEIRDVTLENVKTSHHIELAAIQNSVIEDCTFVDLNNDRGTDSWTEMIQMEPANNANTTWEATGDRPTADITVDGSSFENSIDGEGPVAGIGDHSDNDGVTTDNIDILNCNFVNLEAGVRPVEFDTVLIENCTFDGCDEDVTDDGTNVTLNNNTTT